MPERFEHFRNQIADLPISVVRVAAIDALEISSVEIDYWQQRSKIWAPLSDGEIACFLSHRKAWKTIVSSGEPWAFVAEDDIHVSDDFQMFFGDSCWFPAGTDLIKAETSRARIVMSLENSGQAHGHGVRRLVSDHTGSGGYFISRNGADKLLRLSETICEPADRFLFSPDLPGSSQLNVYQIDPALCIQDVYLTDQYGGVGLGGHIPCGGFDPAMPKPKRKGIAKFRHEVMRPIN